MKTDPATQCDVVKKRIEEQTKKTGVSLAQSLERGLFLPKTQDKLKNTKHPTRAMGDKIDDFRNSKKALCYSGTSFFSTDPSPLELAEDIYQELDSIP